MHVALICPYSFGRFGGVQEHTRGLAAALRASGHAVTVFASDVRGEGPGTVSLGRSVAVPANGSVAPLAVDPRMLVRLDPGLDPADVVHVQEPFLPASLAAAWRTPRSVPVVGTFHAAADRSLPYALAAPVLRRASRRLAASIAVSPEARALARRYVDVDPVIVPNGVDVAAFAAAEPDPWMVSLGRTVLFVGRGEPRKGFDVLLRAFSGVAATRSDVHLVCTADQAGVLAEGVAPRVHCLGRVEQDRKLSLMRAATVLAVPSLGSESFGVVVAEGMAAGAAVLASDIPGYRHAGLGAVRYAPPGDVRAWRETLAGLLDDADEAARLAVLGRARAAELDWPVVAARVAQVYAAALDRA